MKTVAEFPAYIVMDMEAEVMDIPRAIAENFEFALAYESSRHGTLHNLYKLSSVAAYAARNNRDEAAEVERAKSRGEKLFWLNECSIAITAHKHAQEVKFLIKDGQRIRFDGQLLQVVVHRGNRAQVIMVDE